MRILFIEDNDYKREVVVENVFTQIALGEDSSHQFKEDIHNIDSLASEMVAFANASGGIIFIGVTDQGTAIGVPTESLSRINQLISQAASQHVRSPLSVRTENMVTKEGRIVIAVSIPDGIDKPYFDKNGIIWLKCGADKRRIHSKEELRRLFQAAEQFHADEMPTQATIEQLDRLRYKDFL
ncbi:MAG: ATP-binding protein, partial [Chlamydiae bacterium]|nr:ATP-binding protein [Chlamydiota bacterium]